MKCRQYTEKISVFNSSWLFQKKIKCYAIVIGYSEKIKCRQHSEKIKCMLLCSIIIGYSEKIKCNA